MSTAYTLINPSFATIYRIMKAFLNLLLICLAYTGTARQFSFNLSIETDLGALAGAKVEVFQEKDQVASLLSDAQGKVSVHLNVFEGTEITLVVSQPFYKRYMIDITKLNEDFDYRLKLAALTEAEQKRIEEAEKGKAKLTEGHATIFLRYNPEEKSMEAVGAESFSANRKLKVLPVVMYLPPKIGTPDTNPQKDNSAVFQNREQQYNAEQAAARAEEQRRQAAWEQKKAEDKAEKKADKVEKEEEKQAAEVKKAQKEMKKSAKEQEELAREQKKVAKEQKQMERALRQEAKKQKKEAKQQEQEAKKAEKWEGRMASYEKKLAKYHKQQVDIDKKQRKLDKKIRKEKISAEDAKSAKRNIEDQRKSLDKRISDLETKMKKHRKDRP